MNEWTNKKLMKSIHRSVKEQITSKQLVNQYCPNNWERHWFNLLSCVRVGSVQHRVIF